MKILVVEDDLVTGTLLKKVLTKQGYDVTHTIDGTKALEALQADIYRIILTDWMMPEMDGPTLCRHVREMNFEQYIYIILLTAKSSKDDAVAGLESGADDYIVKPFDKQELLARIRAGRRLVDLEDTNRHTLQKLSRSEKMAAVGHLAAGVAHEVNNPIGFINSNLNSLKDYIMDIQEVLGCYRELAKALDQSISQNKPHIDFSKLYKKSIQMEKDYEIDLILEDTNDLIEDCSDGALRIKSIVHEMRFFAHPERQSFECKQLDYILGKVLEQFESQIYDHVTIQNETENLPEIECNAPHIEQALINIIKNATQAIETKGHIVIKNRVHDKKIEIDIKDDGKGIEPENISKIFNPFFSTLDVGKGVGLGLTTALNIIKMHNGSIHCKSEPDKGACFTIVLPFAPECA